MSTHAESTTASEPVLPAWQERSAPFGLEVAAVQDWEAASPCAGWTARDVFDHVLGTEREAFAQHGHPLPPAPEGDPVTQWEAHLCDVDVLLADPEMTNRPVDGAFGPTTLGAILLEFYGTDLLVHRWDLARSQDRDARLTEAELRAIETALDGWGEHAYSPGIFTAPLEVPGAADLQVRVLARTGRRA